MDCIPKVTITCDADYIATHDDAKRFRNKTIEEMIKSYESYMDYENE
jgi:hypothetical protein